MTEDYREKYQRVYAEVDLDAICGNMLHMKENLMPDTQMLGVIKADGYGHGAIPIARELEGLEFLFGFATATAEEALELRNADITKPILILGYTFPYSYESLIREKVRMTVFREDTLDSLAEIVRRKKTGKARVHIKVDTGMGRIGISPDRNGLSFVKRALSMEEIEVEGIFTHFARADETDKASAKGQLALFRRFLAEIHQELGADIPVKHCSNSAGIIELPQANMDMVRAGITLYGLWPSKEVSRSVLSLTPALSLYSRIVYCKEIKTGTPVSYGGTFIAPKDMRIATIPVGYGDGYPRSLSGKGYVLVRGQRAPILGRVCMDQFMVDVTEIPKVEQGDRVTLIGRDGDKEISMEELGELSGRFNYELACDLGKRVPRIYRKEGRTVCIRDAYGM